MMTTERPHVCLVTCRAYPTLSASDVLYAKALEALGCRVAVHPWNATPFSKFLEHDVLVLRATWDAPEDISGFMAWLDRIEREGPFTLNRPPLAGSNIDKRSIMKLGEKGNRLPRTVLLTGSICAQDAMDTLDASVAVLKPCWGGDGVGVEKVTRETGDASAARLHAQLGRPLMIQEYLPEIEKGEFSFVFVGGSLAHVVLKRPAPGEFRVNSRFAPPRREVVEPTRDLRSDASAVLHAVGEPTLYARIDGVERGGRLICTEVELTDPSLYLDLVPSTAHLLAEATTAAVRSRS